MIGLLLSPLARWLGGAAMVLTIVGGVYLKGRSDGAANCEAAWLQRVATEMERQRKISDRILTVERTLAEAREAEIASLEEKVNDYEAELASRPDGGCVLGPDDARRLQDIR